MSRVRPLNGVLQIELGLIDKSCINFFNKFCRTVWLAVLLKNQYKAKCNY